MHDRAPAPCADARTPPLTANPPIRAASASPHPPRPPWLKDTDEVKIRASLFPPPRTMGRSKRIVAGAAVAALPATTAGFVVPQQALRGASAQDSARRKTR